MKMISKIANVALGLVLVGSSVFAQSLADAKRAIDAEQYQKAKTMLKNLTVTQPKSNDENFFYLGWTYLQQDYIDSAKTAFTQGLAADPKSALNYAGLGVVAHLNKDAAGANSNFAQVKALVSKKDSKPWVYMGEGLLMPLPGSKVVNTVDADAAIAALKLAIAANPKDAEAALALGNAYRTEKNTTDAYSNYDLALTLDPKSPGVHVARGVLWSNAHNFDGAIEEFKNAIGLDPNYGPAYREWAETDLAWSFDNKAVASAKISEGVEKYQKYMSLTDQSDETLMRYADFLINGGRWKELQEVASTLAKHAGSNIRAYRYLGYAAYETKDFPTGLTAINNWFAKAEPVRILPRDYYYLGRLQIASGKDTVAGIGNLKKAADLDSTLADNAYTDIINIYKGKKDYLNAAKTYEEVVNRMHGRAPVTNYIYQGIYYYISFNPKSPDSTLLVKADSALSRANQRLVSLGGKINPDAIIYRARIADLKEPSDLTKIQGLAKPFYDKYIELVAPTFNIASATRTEKSNLPEAYAYEGNYALYHDKDDAKAMDFYTKAKDIDPNNKQAKFYFDQKAAAAAPAPGKKSK